MNFRALLPVQAVDNRLAQLEHRKSQLPEHGVAAAAKRTLEVARNDIQKMEKRQAEIARDINRYELHGKDLDAKKAKFEAQLKSVIAMREIEALQHEIAMVAAQHSAQDDAEIVLLDESETLAAKLAALREAMPRLEGETTTTGAQLATAVNSLDAEIAAAQAERTRLVALVDAESMALYSQLRARMTSAAVAEIVKGSCGGCHTAMSPKEQADLKKVADTPDASCPYCGCLLVA